MKTTPGKWEAGTGTLKGGEQFHIIVFAKDNPERITAMCGYSGAEDENESIANAHLIAAAPDMYEALKSFWDKLKTANDEHRCLEFEDIDKSYQMCHLAIAKAEGK